MVRTFTIEAGGESLQFRYPTRQEREAVTKGEQVFVELLLPVCYMPTREEIAALSDAEIRAKFASIKADAGGLWAEIALKFAEKIGV